MSFYYILLEQTAIYVMEFPSNLNLASRIVLLAILVAYCLTCDRCENSCSFVFSSTSSCNKANWSKCYWQLKYANSVCLTRLLFRIHVCLNHVWNTDLTLPEYSSNKHAITKLCFIEAPNSLCILVHWRISVCGFIGAARLLSSYLYIHKNEIDTFRYKLICM
jgi:hypothetical protein